MSTPDDEPPTRLDAEPGERPPRSGAAARRHLDRPPSERYGGPATSQTGSTSAGGGRASATRADGSRASASRASGGSVLTGSVVAAVVVAVGGAALLTLILGAFTSTAGTFAVSGIASVTIGLLVASGTIPQPRTSTQESGSGVAPATFDRDQAARLAIGIAIGMIVLTGLALWILARFEGGVLDPVAYVWTTFGLGLPAQAVVALIGAAWGAANGPIRWRQ